MGKTLRFDKKMSLPLNEDIKEEEVHGNMREIAIGRSTA
jgi:hypothetical protein